MKSLGWERLNRAVLDRQLLMERSRLPLHRVVERMAGVQAQYIPSAYIGLWSRTEGFTRDTLTGALERGSVIQGTLMRGTIHLVSRADYWPITAAIRDVMREWWLRVDQSGRSAEDMEKLAGRLKIALADSPKRRAQLIDELGIETWAWSGVSYWVELVRVPPSGTWDSRRADLYALAADWVGPGDGHPATGSELLIRRYLAGFGPASRDDIKAFTRFGLTVIDDVLERLPLRRFAGTDGGLLFDVRRAPIPEPDAPAPVRFLGTWDASLLVHARRAQILPEEYRDRIFNTKAPHSFNTFLVDGQVRGTWKKANEKILLEKFQPIPRRFHRELNEESDRLATLLA